MNRFNKLIYLLPICGIITFISLYIYSSIQYPGGSQANIHSEGFDWINNYWCNLTNEFAINGEINTARRSAVTALIILCFSLLVFFILFSKSYSKNRYWKLSIQWSGIASMIFAALIFTEYHDLMIILSSIFGLITVVGVMREIYIEKRPKTLYSGIICLFLLGLNNFIYYSNIWIEVLPLLQKVTFAFILIWILIINKSMLKKSQSLMV